MPDRGERVAILGGGMAGVTAAWELSRPGWRDRFDAIRLYQRLVLDDLADFLGAEPEASADLCVAADVFIYVGDLAPVLATIARVLRPGGLAAFTVQSHDGAGVILGADARFAHADAYLDAAAGAAGLLTAMREPAAIRREGGLDVPGRLVILARPRAGSCGTHAARETSETCET